MNYEIKNAWGILLRLYHWSLVLSIVTLVATGFYINSPWTNTTLEGVGAFPMATMRYIHFLAGYVFTAAVLVRLFLYLFGNRQERIWDVLPVTPRNIKSLSTTLGYYSYLSDKHDGRLGHNVLAGLTYILTIALAVLQFLSGFYLLYPESALWQGWGGVIFGSQQQGRFLHHLLMWYFILFAFAHVYMVIWNDLKSPEGLISSIFTGNKFKHKNT
ncbi:MAG: Ni/Fe-hydrogenase, b-type cytochrome subunit [Proteobacteria bacterium]|nr:Ni/Fe-hydrogenase, b-type cytochrome subunit [Pseudomonadota bacterium]MBU1137734.1 Ni/Fe-hydrogenase, b-type cytochrome subunit [Pseudomonadota bacterium]MBU1420309.1 Ni/Fe-hydrogenase, b-type cytochrome subunit [Pseudomonadota bacterium]